MALRHGVEVTRAYLPHGVAVLDVQGRHGVQERAHTINQVRQDHHLVGDPLLLAEARVVDQPAMRWGRRLSNEIIVAYPSPAWHPQPR